MESVQVSRGEGAVLLGMAVVVEVSGACLLEVDGAVPVHGLLLLYRSGAVRRGRS